MDSKVHRPSALPWTKKTLATPTARGNLLDNPGEDGVPITRVLSLLNSTPPWRGRCQTRCYKTRSKILFFSPPQQVQADSTL